MLTIFLRGGIVRGFFPPPDCPFHLNPAPTQFIEVKVATPVGMDYNVHTIEGTLTLGGADEQGIFYKMLDASEV